MYFTGHDSVCTLESALQLPGFQLDPTIPQGTPVHHCNNLFL